MAYDIESALRRHLRERADEPKIAIWVNNEDRMVLTITNEDDTQSEFVVFGDNARPYSIKPPTQAISIPTGIDAHGPMGARS